MDEPVTESVVEEPKPVKKKPKTKKKAPAKAKTAKGSEKAKAAKPKAKMEVPKDQYGLRKDSTKSAAAAMYARAKGATLAEVKEKVGSIQLNVLQQLEDEGWTIEREKETKKGRRPATRYWLKPKA